MRAAHIGLGAALGIGLATAAWAEAVSPEAHWPMPPAELEERLARDDFEILTVRGDVGGVMNVRKLKILFPSTEQKIAVKWKEAPTRDADGWNNAPRKEIAAYQIQKWFLDPEDYVVPTTVLRCIPLEAYEPIADPARPNLSGTKCMVGTLVVWLEEVTVPDVLYEEERFEADPLYAHHMANLNLLTYLIDHEDGRQGNFLTAEDERDRRVFSIDNGVSFGSKVKNFFVPNWNKIRVPALRKESIERLRAIDDEDLQALGVIAEMRADPAGVLRPVPATQNAEPRKGARVKPGWIQLGLSRGEIEDVRKRLDRLLAECDAGRQPLY